MTIENLLHPKDAQNVSRAVQLLSCIVEIKTIDRETLDPSQEAEFEALCPLGEVFHYLLQPFINPTLSLSEQITSLPHLKNSTSFMSNQLYGDLQTMVKAAIMLVARTQILDPLLEVLICLLGDNPVETLFGRTRMKGGHSPNCSIFELLYRLCSAMNMDTVFDHHPELERTPRRLRGRDADHPSGLLGGGGSGSGVYSAQKLSKSFAELFKKPDVDLLRPFGGKYPALSADIDRSLTNFTSPQPDDGSTIQVA
ncbi:hypothetical protein R3P38DRAFT_2785715 [Favolaschia claudopus]|uniref:Uncharacterized protein n=1 Tax=Favolaschia claudopus TaxID=2862362 RepID=A0AAW0AUI9_9AGAR